MGTFSPDILAGRVALVTGGGTGIGKEIARTLADHGAKLCIAARRQEVLEETKLGTSRLGATMLAGHQVLLSVRSGFGVTNNGLIQNAYGTLRR